MKERFESHILWKYLINTAKKKRFNEIMLLLDIISKDFSCKGYLKLSTPEVNNDTSLIEVEIPSGSPAWYVFKYKAEQPKPQKTIYE